MKESELYEPLKKFLLEESQFGVKNVYAEVGLVDVVGIFDTENGQKESISLEMKLRLNDKVIQQAIRDLRFSNYVYIVVPELKKEHKEEKTNILKAYGIGLIYVKFHEDGSYTVREFIQPTRTKKIRYNIKSSVKKFHETLIGGVKSGDGDTEYKQTIRNIKEFMQNKKEENINSGWVTVKELTENVQTHFSSPKGSIYQTLKARWNSDWCETTKIRNKVYFRMKE